MLCAKLLMQIHFQLTWMYCIIYVPDISLIPIQNSSFCLHALFIIPLIINLSNIIYVKNRDG